MNISLIFHALLGNDFFYCLMMMLMMPVMMMLFFMLMYLICFKYSIPGPFVTLAVFVQMHHCLYFPEKGN